MTKILGAVYPKGDPLGEVWGNERSDSRVEFKTDGFPCDTMQIFHVGRGNEGTRGLRKLEDEGIQQIIREHIRNALWNYDNRKENVKMRPSLVKILDLIDD